MKRKHNIRAAQTLNCLNSLLDSGIDRCSLIVRHSERFFTKDARMEPFMALTPHGRDVAFDFGRSLRPDLAIQLHSSFFGRCVETAYLIDKGYSHAHQTTLPHNDTHATLAPFYIKDIEPAIGLLNTQGVELFLRNWFDHRIDESIMENPEKTADCLCDFMINQIDQLPEKTISISVSHDWNIFPIKEFKMGIPHEGSGDVGYLDGLIFFRQNNQYHVTSFQSDPIPL
jgi:hypothetical protein